VGNDFTGFLAPLDAPAPLSDLFIAGAPSGFSSTL
jgi:hypothetical protein